MKHNMMTYPLIGLLALLSFTSCEEDYMSITNPDAGRGKTAGEETRVYMKQKVDWPGVADSVSSAFIKRFYCDVNRGDRADGVFSYSEYNRKGGNWWCYWQQAHAMAVMVEWYNRIKDSDDVTAATLKNYMSRWFGKFGNNPDYYNNPQWRGTYGFGNDFTDDTIWIGIALIQMYEATGEEVYLTAAKSTWDECVRPRFAVSQYPWLPWKWTDLKTYNECTNGPGSIYACMLAGYARQNGNEEEYEQYLDEAFRCFDQNIQAMDAVGRLRAADVPLSYTQGTCMEAGRLLWHLTGEVGYLRKGIMAARGQMSEEMNEIYKGEFFMRNEGADENNAIFHAVFYHWAARMIADREIDKVDPAIRRELYVYVLRHCWYYWNEGIEKKPSVVWENSYFSTWPYRVRAAADGGSLGAYTSAAQAFESMCLIKDVQF